MALHIGISLSSLFPVHPLISMFSVTASALSREGIFSIFLSIPKPWNFLFSYLFLKGLKDTWHFGSIYFGSWMPFWFFYTYLHLTLQMNYPFSVYIHSMADEVLLVSRYIKANIPCSLYSSKHLIVLLPKSGISNLIKKSMDESESWVN